MIRKFLTVAMVVAIGCVVAAPAQAGGTGTKKVATIRVQNKTLGGSTVGVSTSAPTVDNLASASAFQAAGGQAIAPGAVGSFKVPAGASTLYAGYQAPFPVDPATLIAGQTAASLGVTGVAGKTGYAVVSGDSTIPTMFFNGSATKF